MLWTSLRVFRFPHFRILYFALFCVSVCRRFFVFDVVVSAEAQQKHAKYGKMTKVRNAK